MPRKKTTVSMLVNQFLRHRVVLPVMEFLNLGCNKPGDERLPTPNDLLAFYKKRKVIHTADGQHRGHEIIVFTRHGAPGYILTPTFTDSMSVSIKNGYFVPLGDERWRDLPPQLEAMRAEYGSFIETASAGHIELEALNKWAQNARDYNLVFKPDQSNPFKPIVRQQSERTENIESYLETQILHWFINGQGEIFTRIARCQWCGNFFFRTRPDALYCRRACSCSKRSQDFRDTGKHAEYMKKKRSEGFYQ